MTKIETNELVSAAVAARSNAYARYSGFRVGAALQSSDGTIYHGVNVENASYGLTICAERTSVVAALTGGQRQFVAMAIASAGGVPPCGACRQFLAEFNDELPILLIDVDNDNSCRQVNLRDLLPEQFKL